MLELSNDPNVTDWITALASVGAMFGTVGAVWFALWQVRHRGQLGLHTQYEYVEADEGRDPSRYLAVTATHMGGPPVLVTAAYQEDRHGGMILGGYSLTKERITSEGFPALLTEAQQLTIYWNAGMGQAWMDRGDNWYRAVVVTSMRGTYRTPYPGVQVRRHGLLRRKRYEKTRWYGR